MVDVDGGAVVVAFPNAVHRDRGQADIDAVQARLADHFGRQVRLRLVVGDGPRQESLLEPGPAAGAGGGGGASSASAPAPPGSEATGAAGADSPAPDEEPFDHHDLEPAPGQPADGVPRSPMRFPAPN